VALSHCCCRTTLQWLNQNSFETVSKLFCFSFVSVSFQLCAQFYTYFETALSCIARRRNVHNGPGVRSSGGESAGRRQRFSGGGEQRPDGVVDSAAKRLLGDASLLPGKEQHVSRRRTARLQRRQLHLLLRLGLLRTGRLLHRLPEHLSTSVTHHHHHRRRRHRHRHFICS